MSRTGASTVKMQRTAGTARLSFACVDGRIHVREMYQDGAAKVRLLSVPGHLHVEAVAINTAGGLTGGDVLDWRVAAEAGASVSITTQACEKIYRSSSDLSEVSTVIDAQAGARLAWLPQETIVFDQSALRRKITGDIHPSAEAVICESIVFGRQKMGESVTSGFLHDRWRIRRGGELLHAEDFLIDASTPGLLQRKPVLSRNIALSTLLMVGDRFEAVLPVVRELIGENGAAAFWNGKLLARVATADSYTLRRIICPVIAAVNPAGGVPKVWSI